jgi:hypothetical protein
VADLAREEPADAPQLKSPARALSVGGGSDIFRTGYCLARSCHWRGDRGAAAISGRRSEVVPGLIATQDPWAWPGLCPLSGVRIHHLDFGREGSLVMHLHRRRSGRLPSRSHGAGFLDHNSHLTRPGMVERKRQRKGLSLAKRLSQAKQHDVHAARVQCDGPARPGCL